MATMFKKGDNVKLMAVVPEGPIEALRMDEDGNFHYLISWTDVNGIVQSRWFEEAQLTAA